MNFADVLRRLEPTAEITALGTVRGLDTTLIPAVGYPPHEGQSASGDTHAA
jgi:UDP-N-acetylglucosamine--N-acetylmuramyl-(pentapeptide) pyrophosphoryl-undecaprenol N-acetylglucosamine transferase